MEWRKSPFRLRELKIEVTHDCMLRCVHCSSVAGANSGRSVEWPSCERILNDAVAMGVKEVAFSGGEPLLWNHIEDAVARASKLGMKVLLYTTGNMPNAQKTLGNLQTAGLSYAIFSLFGMSADQHEKVTAVKGSYGKTIEIASYCVSIGLDMEFHFVPLSHNYKSLQGVAEQASRIGVKRISLLRLVPQGRGAKEKDQQLNHSENLELCKIVKALRAAGHDIRLGSPYNFLMLQEKPQCRSGIDRMTVGPDLRIFPCDAFKHISPKEIGASSEYSNLRECSLPECWEKSPYLGVVRKYLTTDFAIECKTCQKLEACHSGCMAQKFYACGELRKCPDPLCLFGHV
jgi:radical SAM protein with 4Fe4S-binding SPASM domain